uniref:NADH-ubiquinone oxidoreductase chain 6 n=1 Tax=Gyrohypnus fracticornis TaxID=346779 RepID=A0A0S2M7C0_9COLE|nr:NADH deshydrogenase subunit 6 [Gyrohypnus fracticornis]
MTLMFMSMLNSFLFITMNHPLSMGMILLIQTILIAMIMGFLMFNLWFSYILFLIMIGGMLILFIYMTSIASNEKFKFSINYLIIPLIMPVIMYIIFTQDNLFFNLINLNIESLEKFNSINKILNKFINFPNNYILTMLIIYLFITLIAVVKIADSQKGPLRQKY